MKTELDGTQNYKLRDTADLKERTVEKTLTFKLTEGELLGVLSTIRKGTEDRVVKCIEQKDFVNHMVHYIFNGEVLHSRAMEMHERQLEIVKQAQPVEKKGTLEDLGASLKQ